MPYTALGETSTAALFHADDSCEAQLMSGGWVVVQATDLSMLSAGPHCRYLQILRHHSGSLCPVSLLRTVGLRRLEGTSTRFVRDIGL